MIILSFDRLSCDYDSLIYDNLFYDKLLYGIFEESIGHHRRSRSTYSPVVDNEKSTIRRSYLLRRDSLENLEKNPVF